MKSQTLLTKHDALIFAADNLERMAQDIELVAIIAPVLVGAEAKVERDDKRTIEAMAELRERADAIVDKDIQLSVLRDAAKDIRAMVQETKLADARAVNKGINV